MEMCQNSHISFLFTQLDGASRKEWTIVSQFVGEVLQQVKIVFYCIFLSSSCATGKGDFPDSALPLNTPFLWVLLDLV